MDKTSTVKRLLDMLGLPPAQQSDLCVLTVLALANLTRNARFEHATNEWMRIHDVIAFTNTQYGTTYAENSRETFRKQAMHHFRRAALIEDNGTATNSPNYKYRLTAEFLRVLQTLPETYELTSSTQQALNSFLQNHERLKEMYASKKAVAKLPVRINQTEFSFSPGDHNLLQKAVLEEFAPRFAPNAECLYVGDTTKKDLVRNTEKLATLGFEITLHDKLPDIILYRADKHWLYFIEAVTSVGSITADRLHDIEQMTTRVNAGKIYVTAFPNFAKFKKFSAHLAWETEVWIAETPDHLIHLNGDRFMGPRPKAE